MSTKQRFGPSIYPRCGEYAGWNQHKRDGTKVCEPCNAASNTYMRERRHRLGESKGTWIYIPDPLPMTADHYCI